MSEWLVYILCFGGVFGLFVGTDRVIQSLYTAADTQNQILGRLRSVQKETKKKISENSFVDFLEKYNILDYFKNINEEKIKEIKLVLQKAGFRAPNSVAIYLATKMTLCIVTFALGLFGVTVLKVSDNLLVQMLGPFGLTYVVYMLVDAHIQSMIQDRQKAVQKGIPDALDLMVICTEAGMGIDHAIRRVGMEMDTTHAVLAEEFKLTVVELGVSSDRIQVFLNLAARIDLPQMHAIINSIVQSMEFGTPISVTLQTLSEEYRKERMLAAESRASRLPALMTLPLMFFILPTLFIVLIGPVIIKALNS